MVEGFLNTCITAKWHRSTHDIWETVTIRDGESQAQFRANVL
jgi:hypothetical protein